MVETCEKCPYSVRMREDMDQNNSDYGHSLCSDVVADKQIQDLCGEIANLSENVQSLMNANERLNSEVMVGKKYKQDFRK